MASDESMTIRSSISIQEDDYDDADIDGSNHDDHQSHHPNFSRLSICTNSCFYGADAEDDDDDRNYYQTLAADQDNDMRMYLSRLSIESFDDGEVEEEYYSSDEKRVQGRLTVLGLSLDSEKEAGCYSLPATPPRRRRSLAGGVARTTHDDDQCGMKGVKEYASDNGGAEHKAGQKKMSRDLRKRRRRRRERLLLDRERGNWKKELEMNMMEMDHHHHMDISGESEGGGSSTTLVITRPKGGRRSLCMDLEEVKACRDLGFELEHQRMLEMPTANTGTGSAISLSAPSTLDTTSSTSGGDSPIANWRISSPGDDPRDVKARLKVWAQAVALASASRHTT